MPLPLNPGWGLEEKRLFVESELGVLLVSDLADADVVRLLRESVDDVMLLLSSWMILSGLTNTPCFSLHLKYLTPLNVPLCLPIECNEILDSII